MKSTNGFQVLNIQGMSSSWSVLCESDSSYSVHLAQDAAVLAFQIRSRRIAVDASKVQVPKGLHQYLDVDVVVRHLTAPTPTMHRRAVAVQAASIVLESLNDTSQISDLAVAVFKVLMASELFKFGEAAQHLAPDATWLQWMTACGGIANHASFSQLIQLRRAVCDFFSGLGDAYLRSGAQVSVRSVAEPAPASFRHLVGQALRALEWSVRTDGCLSTFLLREHKQRCLQVRVPLSVAP